ncbi:MAG: hypothetical protein EHM32_05395 [Spirochaetales bacterium]|nr:MAG: hypothetical protein EHM32_05395 [Spirochaetales bacterium]
MRLFGAMLTIVAVFSAHAIMADTGQVRVLEALKDKNVVVEGGPFIEHYWVETDGTKGVIHLTFPGVKTSSGAPRSISLIINIPDIEDSGSNTGCEIVYNGAVVGRLSKGSPNTWVDIPLENMSPGSGTIELVIRGGGEDGLAICSKASGLGPLLKVVY